MATPLWVEYEGGGLTWGDYEDRSYWTDVNNPIVTQGDWWMGGEQGGSRPNITYTRPTSGEIVTQASLNNVTSDF